METKLKPRSSVATVVAWRLNYMNWAAIRKSALSAVNNSSRAIAGMKSWASWIAPNMDRNLFFATTDI